MKIVLIAVGILGLTLVSSPSAEASAGPQILLYGNAKPSLRAPTPGVVGIAQQSAPEVTGNSTTYLVAVWNRSSKPERVYLAGTARLAGTKRPVHTNSTPSTPTIVPPNAVAYGKIIFNGHRPRTASVRLKALIASPATATVRRNTPPQPHLTVDSATVTGAGTMTGSITNPGTSRATPVYIQVFCFIGGTLSSLHAGYVKGTSLTPGATASYAIPLNARCTTFLVGAS